MSKSKSSKSAAPVVTITVVGTVQPEPGKTYVSKSVVKTALRTAAKAAGGKWGLMNVDGDKFSILRDGDWAVLGAERKAGSSVLLTIPPLPVEVAPAETVEPVKAEPVAVEPAATVKPKAPRKSKAKAEKAAQDATSEGVVAAPVLVQDENSAFAF